MKFSCWNLRGWIHCNLVITIWAVRCSHVYIKPRRYASTIGWEQVCICVYFKKVGEISISGLKKMVINFCPHVGTNACNTHSPFSMALPCVLLWSARPIDPDYYQWKSGNLHMCTLKIFGLLRRHQIIICYYHFRDPCPTKF